MTSDAPQLPSATGGRGRYDGLRTESDADAPLTQEQVLAMQITVGGKPLSVGQYLKEKVLMNNRGQDIVQGSLAFLPGGEAASTIMATSRGMGVGGALTTAITHSIQGGTRPAYDNAMKELCMGVVAKGLSMKAQLGFAAGLISLFGNPAPANAEQLLNPEMVRALESGSGSLEQVVITGLVSLGAMAITTGVWAAGKELDKRFGDNIEEAVGNIKQAGAKLMQAPGAMVKGLIQTADAVASHIGMGDNTMATKRNMSAGDLIEIERMIRLEDAGVGEKFRNARDLEKAALAADAGYEADMRARGLTPETDGAADAKTKTTKAPAAKVGMGAGVTA